MLNDGSGGFSALSSNYFNFIPKSGGMERLRKKLYDVIFHSDTPVSKGFDLVLIFVILISVLAVILESVPVFRRQHYDSLHTTEWVITVIFTVEYLARIWTHPKPLKYMFSFYGIIDFLAIIPTYLDLIFTGAMGFAVIRGLRLLRIFRILKITRYSREGRIIVLALSSSRYKILVFLFAVLMVVLIIGTLMYLVEGVEGGFTSIPSGIYWAITTLTTVGFGDITPITPFGKFIASFVMIVGYGVIAVPTGIVTFEIASAVKTMKESRVCDACGHAHHDADANYCKSCGEKL
jgi:voltage-gated potassium channel